MNSADLPRDRQDRADPAGCELVETDVALTLFVGLREEVDAMLPNNPATIAMHRIEHLRLFSPSDRHSPHTDDVGLASLVVVDEFPVGRFLCQISPIPRDLNRISADGRHLPDLDRSAPS